MVFSTSSFENFCFLWRNQFYAWIQWLVIDALLLFLYVTWNPVCDKARALRWQNYWKFGTRVESLNRIMKSSKLDCEFLSLVVWRDAPYKRNNEIPSYLFILFEVKHCLCYEIYSTSTRFNSVSGSVMWSTIAPVLDAIDAAYKIL